MKQKINYNSKLGYLSVNGLIAFPVASLYAHSYSKFKFNLGGLTFVIIETPGWVFLEGPNKRTIILQATNC